MSWDSYIDNLLGHAGGHGDKAAIIGLDGSKWTSDGHLQSLKVTPQEAKQIGQVLAKNPVDFTPFQAGGVHLEGMKYQFLRGEEKLVLAKKKEEGAITMQKSKTAVIIGHTREGGQQGNVNKAVAVIAEYLESLGM